MAGINIAADSIGYTSATPMHELGQQAEVGGKRYRYVYNTGSATITQYYPCCYAATNQYYIGDTGSDLGDTVMAGVAATAIASAEYGWLCIQGIYSCRVSAAFQTTGVALIGAGSYVTVAAATTNVKVGYSLGTTTAAGNLAVMLACA